MIVELLTHVHCKGCILYTQTKQRATNTTYAGSSHGATSSSLKDGKAPARKERRLYNYLEDTLKIIIHRHIYMYMRQLRSEALGSIPSGDPSIFL